ncbi:MAG TPA: kelch repeat-containing protein [Bradyrhizobium sp.]|nr:kelch repeat-containing protein [Bradyrhizobium sp.]
MATVFPSGNDPYIFSDSLAQNSSDTSQPNLDLHAGAFDVADFTSAVAPGATTINLTFVIFAYPMAANTQAAFPQVPIVEVLDQNSGPEGHGTSLHPTPDGTAAFAVSGTQFVNYSLKTSGGGVSQIVFSVNNVPLDSLSWRIRFTINDGVTSDAAQKGLTFVVDTADARAPWLAVPGQLNLPPTGPMPIDFAAALKSITLAGPAPPGSFGQLEGNQTYTVLLPVGNYGTGPLTISGVTAPATTNGFSIRLLTAPLTVAPGSVDQATLQATFQAPSAEQSAGAATPTAFTLACNDPLAVGGGKTAHFNFVSLFTHVRQHNVWAARQQMPTARFSLAAAVAGNGKLYAIGGTVSGLDDLQTVEEYDPVTDNWATTAKALMPTARQGLGLAAAGNGKLYAVGGSGGSAARLTAVEEYDPVNNSWAVKQSMRIARTHLGLAVRNGKLYAVGGIDENLDALPTVEVYDFATNTWVTKKPMTTARSSLGLALASNGKLYAVGGLNHAALFSAMTAVEEYDPETDNWTTKAPLQTPRMEVALAAASNGKLYAVGGSNLEGTLATVEEYDPTTNVWTTKAPMKISARTLLGLAAAQDGNLYAVGGNRSQNELQVTQAVEAYSP